jgi:hypothetical protein
MRRHRLHRADVALLGHDVERVRPTQQCLDRYAPARFEPHQGRPVSRVGGSSRMPDAKVIRSLPGLGMILDEIAAPLLKRHGVGCQTVGALLCAAARRQPRTARNRSQLRRAVRHVTGARLVRQNEPASDSTAPVTGTRTPRCGPSSWSTSAAGINRPLPTSNDAPLTSLQTRSDATPQSLRGTRILRRHPNYHHDHRRTQHRCLTPRGASDMSPEPRRAIGFFRACWSAA